MRLSAFGQKFTADAGITSLMDDLGNAMASGDDLIMMGGGNPAIFLKYSSGFGRFLFSSSQSDADMRRLVGVLRSPSGRKAVYCRAGGIVAT